MNEIFHSLQGEGVRAGTANLFLRFGKCNQTCTVESHGFDCDTEFASGRMLTLDEVVAELRATGDCDWIVLTGGEPALQVDVALIDRLHEEGWLLAVETNGSIELPTGLDWITVSPKVAEHALRQLVADEVKYVRHRGMGIPQPRVNATHRLLSPASTADGVDPAALAWCVQLVKDNPGWRLSCQQHRWWRVR